MSENKAYRECMAEITAALKKYDMAGAITVISKERAMFKYEFPTWSVVQFDGPRKIRFRSKREDFPSKAAQHQATELSVHIILQMRDIAAQTFAFCEEIKTNLDKQLKIDHEPFADFDPETEH
ncbi:MAG TPA: hypothetical protein VHT52_18000 [Stellaceae bacterium]|jgi:hypothetical protein|nr:hypothetical protein [Stellaceae bacterium]